MAVDFFRLTNKKSLSTTCNGTRGHGTGAGGGHLPAVVAAVSVRLHSQFTLLAAFCTDELS